MIGRLQRAAALALAVGLGACGRSYVVPPPQAPAMAPLSRQVPLVVLPAIDQRPAAEIEGRHLMPTFIAASSGAAITYESGSSVISDGDELEWTRNGYPGLPVSASTTVSSDLGAALRGAYSAQVQLDPAVTAAEQVAALAAQRHYADDTVVVLPVIDHLTQVTPQSVQGFSSTSQNQVGNTTYQTTTSVTFSQLGDTHWVTMVRLHLFEIRGGQVARHVVRYAARSGQNESTYAAAIVEAAHQVGLVIDREFGCGELPTNAPVDAAPGTVAQR